MAIGFGPSEGVGTTDVIETAFTPTNGEHTFSLWVNMDGPGGSNAGRIYAGSSGATYAGIIFVVSTLRYRYTYSFDTADGGWNPTTNHSNDTWYHYTFQYDPSSATNDAEIYRGTSSLTITESDTPSGTADGWDAPIVIGNSAGGTRHFDGRMMSLASWNALLTADERAALTEGFAPTMIRPDKLEFYMPAIRENQDLLNGGTSSTGTAYYQDDLGLIYPAEPLYPATAAPGTSIADVNYSGSGRGVARGVARGVG